MVREYTSNQSSDSKWFFFTLVFLVIEYGRPQDILPIGALRPAMIAILILIVFIINGKGISRSNYKQIRLIWYFIILLAIYVPFARNNYFAFHSTTNMLSYMPFIISTVVLVNNVDRLRKLITAYIALMIYIALYSLTHGGKGSGNYFGDENDVSLFINMLLPFCYVLFLQEKEKIKKLFYLTGMVSGLAAVVVSFSRGGFVGLVCLGFVIWLYSPRKLVSMALIIFSATILYFASGEEYRKEMSTVTDTEENTASSRLKSWATGWDMFIDNPLGVGGNNFMVRFQDYQKDRFKRGMWGRAAHSLWFTLIPELGIIGIIIYFSLLYYNLKDIFKIRKLEVTENKDIKYVQCLSLAFLASLAGYFASATFISVLYYPHYWYLTGLIIAVANIAMQYKNSGVEREFDENVVKRATTSDGFKNAGYYR